MRTLLFTFILALLSALTSAQTFSNIAIAEASTVCSIAQDEQGMVWLGTEGGLYSYDGYRTIPHNTAADGTVVATRIHSMLVCHNIIYMGTERGLLVYDIRSGRYGQPQGQSPKDIRAVTLHQGRLWMGSATGLYSCDLRTNNILLENRQLHNVYSLLSTPRGLLVGTIDGLALRSPGGSVRRIPIGNGHQPLVNALAPDRGTNDVWIGTEGALYRYDWRTLQPVVPLMGNSIKSLALHGDNIYAGTDNGMFIYNKVSNLVSHALHDSRSARSIANNIVWAVYNDRWGNLWAGTDQGVSEIQRRPFYTYTPLSDITHTGDGNCLHLIFRSADNMLWLGGTNGLIAYSATHGFLPDKGADIAWFRQTSTTHYMSHNRVRRVYSDGEGRVLVCTDHGLNIYNPLTRQMRNVVVVDPSRRYSTAWAYDVVDDGMGRYWICSYMGGVFVVAKEKLLNATDGVVVADRHLLSQLQGMHVWQLVKDGRGRIWARMYDRGLDRIDPKTMRVEHVVGKDRIINDLAADREGNVWAAMDGEIRRFGISASADRSFSIAGYGDNASAMLCQVEGDMWTVMGNDCCILRADGTSLRFGVPGFRPLAICYDRVSGSVLLGGNDAVVSIPTARMNEKRQRCHMFMSGMMVDGKPFVPEEGSTAYLSEVTLASTQNNVTFQLSDLPFSGQQPCVYAYRLKGIDRTWQYMHGERHEISYNALPPGRYTLEVRQIDALGDANDEVLSYGVTILPPWYWSLWAKIVYLIVIAALLVWIMNFYIMRRRLHQERLAKKHIMQESAVRSQFFDNLSRQLKQPLGSLFGSVLDMLHAETDTGGVRRLEQMRHDVVDMNMLVHKALDVMQTRPDNDHTPKTTLDIVDFCRRAADDARSRYGKAVDIDYRTDAPTAYVCVDVVRLQPVLAELIDFAVNNRNAADPVRIAITTCDDRVRVNVTIPGKTIAQNDIPFVFNRYYRMPDNIMPADTNTFALVHEFAEQQGGASVVQSDDNQIVVTMAFDPAQTASAASQHADSAKAAFKEPDADSADARLLAKITDTVEAHIADSDFNVTRLQESLGLGSKLLYRKVKQMTGKTPIEFIRHIRMQRAAIMLREGRFSVSEVMYMVGFSNSSYFSKVFQKTYGITPAEYSRG
mgnify:FL=1